MSEIKRAINIMKPSAEIQKIAIGCRLRDPMPGEFGNINLKGQIFYIEKIEEEKPLSWFFGNQEHTKHIAWKNWSSVAPSNILAELRVAPEVIVNGKYEIDDLELPLKSLCSSIYNSSSVIGHLNSNSDSILITSKIKKRDFIKEIGEYCKIKDFSGFSKFLVFISEERNENHNFKNEKEVVTEIYKTIFKSAPKIRSISSMEEIKSEIWIKLASSGVAIKISDILKIEDREIYAYFSSLSNFNELIDGRSFLHTCHQFDNKKIFSSGDVLYFGVLNGTRHRHDYVFSGTDNISYKIILNNEYNRFSISPVTYKISSTNRSSHYSHTTNTNSEFVDVKEIQSSLKQMKSIFGENNYDVAGTHTNIPINRLIDVRLLSDSLNDFKDYNTNLYDEDWLSKAKSTLTFENDQVYNNITFITSANSMISPSVSDLQAIRSELIEFYQDHYKDKKNFQIPTGSKEEIISKIASQFQKIYFKIKPAIRAAIKVSLGGNFAIQRPYIVETHTPNVKFDPSIKKESILSDKKTNLIMISSSLLASTIGLMEVINDENLVITLSKKFYSKNNSEQTGVNKMSSIDSLTSKKNTSATLISIYDQVARIKNPNSNSMLQKFNLKVLEDSTYLTGLFISICIFEMIENRTFINFGHNPKSVMVQPKDIIKEILDDGQFSSYILRESIYKNGKQSTKKPCLNS